MTSTCVKMIHSLYEQGGEGSPSNPVKFKGQDFRQLKETLLREGRKFEDETFPANLDSLGELEELTAEQQKEVKWCRPHDLNPNPLFVVDGVSRFDFQQGYVGNCWCLSSIGALTRRKSLMAQVVLPDQSFKDNYAGIFHFRFWRFGKWVEVVIDDLLPTFNGELVSVYPRSGTEFWAPLLEKAYAKVCGSYGDMIAGHSSEALKDFSGGVHMRYDLSKPPSDLWDIMIRATQSNTMMGCETFCPEKGKEYETKFGLVAGHIFAATGVKQVDSQGQKVNLVRIWNPWGMKEWNGDWSDQSTLWSTVSKEVQEECLKVRDDGEFWITMEDFCTYFEALDICCDSPNFVDDDAACEWNCSVKEGCWEAGISAGGSDPETEVFWINPQYRLTVKDSKGGNNILLSLLQKHDEEYRSKVNYYYIGFTIYTVPAGAPKGRLSLSLLQDESPPKVSTFAATRELIEMHSLEPGEYLIIPSTYDPDETASFIITVYSKAETDIE